MRNIIVNSLIFVCSILWLSMASLSNLVFGQATPTVTAIPTPQAPTVTTGDVANLEYDGDTGMYTATLTGTVNAHSLPTTAWFEYGTSSGSYSNTSTTQSINGTSDTEVSINIIFKASNEFYYYRIVAENSLGISYGGEESFIDTSGCTCRVCGNVRDAITREGIKDAVVSSNGKTVNTYFGSCGLIEEYGVFVWSDEDKYPCYNIHTIELTASAEGYTPLTQEVLISPCGFAYGVDGGVEFWLQPIATPTPTPTKTIAPTSPLPIVTATPVKETPSQIEVSPRKLRIRKKQGDNVTVKVKSAKGLAIEDEIIKVKVDKMGSKRVMVTPESQETDENGEAKFIITAKGKTGNAKVIFWLENYPLVKESVVVKVLR